MNNTRRACFKDLGLTMFYLSKSRESVQETEFASKLERTVECILFSPQSMCFNFNIQEVGEMYNELLLEWNFRHFNFF